MKMKKTAVVLFFVLVLTMGFYAHGMNLDFHYYGTYVAARLAGYNHNDAQMIAHAAQYVDDSNPGMLDVDKLKAHFDPTPTVQNFEGSLNDIENTVWWQNYYLQTVADVWVPFHFLPGNYGSNANKQNYSGPRSHSGTKEKWSFDDESGQQFKLLCLPNSILVKDMINDIILNHEDKDYTLQMVGLRMHVMADTWAHMYYAGIPQWFINDAGEKVYKIDGTTKTEVEWKGTWPWNESINILSGELATPPNLYYNSMVYQGHGRMGHLPDYPWITYQYSPKWSNTVIIKDNSAYFLNAIKQLTKALNCIRTKTPFDINSYAEFPSNTENVVNQILKTKLNDQTSTWKNSIPSINFNGQPLIVPEDYDKNKWKNEISGKTDIKNTSYFYFNKSAYLHLNFVGNRLAENNLNFVMNRLAEKKLPNVATPREYIVSTKFKNKSTNKYIGSAYNGIIKAISQNYPTMSDTGITLQIIKATHNSLSSGDVVQIKTTETATGEYNYLGAWATPSLYYYLRAYSISGQKWLIEKVNTSGGTDIKAGDQVRFKNVNYADKPYMVPYYSNIPPRDYYLTTQANGTDDKAIWIMEGLTAFDMFLFTDNYFVSDIINVPTSKGIVDKLRQIKVVISGNGNINVACLNDVLNNPELIKKLLDGLTPDQSEQILIQLRKVVNVNGLPSPIAQWNFTSATPLKDIKGNFGDLQLNGGSTVSSCGLALSKGNYARAAAYKGPDIGEKTLVSVLMLNDLTDPRPSGSALTINATDVDRFDGLVFGERGDTQWMAGSNNYVRTVSPTSGTEIAPGKLIMMVATYKKNTDETTHVALYRNGSLLIEYDKGPFPTWTAGKTEVTFGCRYIIDGKPALNFKETNPSYMPATILSAAIYPKALTPDEINKIKGVELIKLIAAQASSSEPGLYNGKTQTPDRLIEGPRTIPNFWNSNSKINDPTPWFWVKLERPAEVTGLVIQWKLADGQLGNRAMKYTVSTSMDGITFTDTGVNQDNVIGLTPNTARDLLPGWAGKTQYIKVNMSNCSYGQTPEYFTCYWVEIYGRPL